MKTIIQMRIVFSTLILALIACNSFAQTDSLSAKAVFDQFKLYYNQNQTDSIYNMFSSEMQARRSLDETKAFLSDVHNQAGNIVSGEFIKFQNDFYSYKSQFEKNLIQVGFSLDDNNLIKGLSIKMFQPDNLPKLVRNSTKMMLPFKEEWTIFAGGDTKELNHHIGSKSQTGAFDIAITDDKGMPYKTDGKTNEDYYSFGKEIIAPCAGEVVLVVDGVKDNLPGSMNPAFLTGNTVIIKTANNEYLIFAHFKQHSIVVKQGQMVNQGQLLGLCGNSGNTTAPHLHFHIQKVEDIGIATGAKCYFDKIIVNGVEKVDYSPIKGEKVKNDL